MNTTSAHTEHACCQLSLHPHSTTETADCTVRAGSRSPDAPVAYCTITAELHQAQLSPVATVSSEAAGERVALGDGGGDLSSPRERSTTPYPLIVVRAAAGGAPRLRGRHAPLRLAFFPPSFSSLREALTYATCAMALLATAEVRT